jgi:hypothetical protein
MAEPKDGEGFFRKVVRFVANPATDWSEIGAKTEETQDLERTEIKAMIERKRRNDFVRKREFDVLRKLRREGLSPEQLAALGGSSKVDDSEARLSEHARSDIDGVKAKIDEIEQQMVGSGDSAQPREPPRHAAPTEPLPLRRPSAPPPPTPAPRPSTENVVEPPPAGQGLMGGAVAPLRPSAADSGRPTAAPAAPVAQGPASVQPPPLDITLDLDGSPLALEVSEAVHDPDFDEAVIAFANADFALSEQAIVQRMRRGGPRRSHSETWLVLFDLYRATGMQAKFEALAIEYANEFGSSAPQWYSLPKLVAEAAANEERPARSRFVGEVGWVCPPVLDIDAVARLRSTTLQLPLPWVLDWSHLQRVETEAAGQLTTLFRQWAPQKLEMRWVAAEQLLGALADASPTGDRDADPAYWMARLEALRLANRPDQFDEIAIDYCVTYEVSPPSWERAACVVRGGGTNNSTTTPPMSIVSEVSTHVSELVGDDHAAVQQVAAVELSGQLAGDISATLQKIDRKLGNAPLVNVSCARLIRVDFIAAGDLLNWVLTKRSENRTVTFTDAHRLIALFFGAMGINEHARVQLIRG